ncbi:MAG TPA: adenylate/guanylate cyclase domain-containing protein [Labilithrix sp.]
MDYEELFDIKNAVDELVEDGMLNRRSVGDVIARVLPELVERCGLRGAFFETYAEDLALHHFGTSDIPGKEDVWTRTSETGREKVAAKRDGALVCAQHLDVAGTWFGRAGFVCAPDADPERMLACLESACEVLDNYLFAIRAAREKHEVTMKLGKALRHRVLAQGLKDAVCVLADALPIDRLLLVCLAEESATKTLHVQQYRGKEVVVDTLSAHGDTLAPVRLLGRRYLAGESNELLAELGIHDAQEEVLINGITKSVVVGKVVVTSKTGGFNTYDRELLASFAGFIRQRVVDFNKEWRSLAYSFRADDVARLLRDDEYEKRFLAPREEKVAILYADIAGFTRLSETVLKTPANVAALVEAWSRDAVEIVFAHGGVFDKMVGDCVIALFGPPFYDEPPGKRLEQALQCAKEIRSMTNQFSKRVGFEHLAEQGLGVSTGVNLASLFVGQFGPNSNFTGFSSGMNNTARLQGCAHRDEILVMDDAIAELPSGHGFAFGEARTALVKNVAEPLRFRPLV